MKRDYKRKEWDALRDCWRASLSFSKDAFRYCRFSNILNSLPQNAGIVFSAIGGMRPEGCQSGPSCQLLSLPGYMGLPARSHCRRGAY